MSKYQRKYPRVELSNGLKISQEVLKRLRKRNDIKDYEISVGAFTNCREVGLTFWVGWKSVDGKLKSIDGKTFCVYEHRNSDQIIINGKDGYVSLSGELPYNTDSKWGYLGSSDYEEYDKATDILVKLIKELN